jgi:hypothetical protein
MKYLKSYKSYSESVQIDVDMDYTFSDILESLSIFQDNLLTSISAESLDLEKEFNYKLKDKNLDLDILVENSGFITALQNKGLKASSVENTDDYETFVSRSMKFLLIRQEDANELMNPKYIVIQNRDESKNRWGDLRLYRVRDNIKKFYDTLSSKTIELEHDGKKYIYTTSNSGNEWNLQNLKENDETFPKYMRKEDLKELIENNKNIKITIV